MLFTIKTKLVKLTVQSIPSDRGMDILWASWRHTFTIGVSTGAYLLMVTIQKPIRNET